ncbi:MAG: response regulator [Lachnospiraceae bacterium]|nr:response regulator [Lachnospiraceae bacterium]
MYRVMLIDDELPVRKLMLSSIDWASLNMEVVGEAASGIEAINVIDDMRPDIAFVDISMPFMNGIEFTEVATKNYPELIIIIMTAFDKFEYARKCVSLPVFDYMLKPMVRTEVTETLLRAKARLDARLGDRSSSLVFGSAIPQEDSADEEASVSEQIMRYIEANYTDSCVNLTSVAQQFGFSSSYLSRKFKQETGRNFLEYLTECRMKKAIELAENNVKMYKASAAVGIPDPNYFGRCFKKYTGKGYSEYVK